MGSERCRQPPGFGGAAGGASDPSRHGDASKMAALLPRYPSSGQRFGLMCTIAPVRGPGWPGVLRRQLLKTLMQSKAGGSSPCN